MTSDQTAQLEFNEQYLMKVGYLATVFNLNGPFSMRNLTPSTSFQIRENAGDVVVGDSAYNGNEWGKVSAVSSDDDPAFVKISVKYPQTTKPAGIDNDDYVPVRTEVYTCSLKDAVSGTTQQNPWQKLASIGVMFYTAPDIPVEAPAITLDSGTPTIHANSTPVSLDFNIGGVSVQKKVNGVASGSPVVANGSGGASMPNGNTVGQSITYVVSKTGYNTATFGPFVVVT